MKRFLKRIARLYEQGADSVIIGNTDVILYQFHRTISLPFPPVKLDHFIQNLKIKFPYSSFNSPYLNLIPNNFYVIFNQVLGYLGFALQREKVS